nr:hypothetical protein [uncultured Prevotella sp.]
MNDMEMRKIFLIIIKLIALIAILLVIALGIYLFTHRQTSPWTYRVAGVEMQKISSPGLGEGDSLQENEVSCYVMIVKLQDAKINTSIIGFKPYFGGIEHKVKKIEVLDNQANNLVSQFYGIRHFENIPYKQLGFAEGKSSSRYLKSFPLDSLTNVPDTLQGLGPSITFCPKLADGCHYYCVFLSYKGKNMPRKVRFQLDSQESIECDVNNYPVPIQFEGLIKAGSLDNLTK